MLDMQVTCENIYLQSCNVIWFKQFLSKQSDNATCDTSLRTHSFTGGETMKWSFKKKEKKRKEKKGSMQQKHIQTFHFVC